MNPLEELIATVIRNMLPSLKDHKSSLLLLLSINVGDLHGTNQQSQPNPNLPRLKFRNFLL